MYRTYTFKTLLSYIITILFIFYFPLAFASKIKVDANAPEKNRATIKQAANGVKIVDIVKPSAAGVSVNTFTQYNVSGEGLILNNADTLVQTQLGGYIQGNTNYAAGDKAKLIVNQVSGNSASKLNGYTEIAGKQANLIIANPNGISCDGCGFINTNKATLTTGEVHTSSQGLDYIDVKKGRISIDGQGMNASNLSEAELIARAISIHAEIYAPVLNLIAGSNRIDRHGTVQAQAGEGETPELAIHLGSASGLFANTIKMLSSEAGLGVNSEGYISTRHFNLSADGKITLQENSSISTEKLVLAAPELSNRGVVESFSDASIELEHLTNAGEFYFWQSKPLLLDLASFNNQSGKLFSSGDLYIDHNNAGINNQGGEIFSAKNLHISAFSHQNLFNNEAGLVAASGKLNLQFEGAYHFQQSSGDIQANEVHVQAQGIILEHDWLQRGSLVLSSSEGITLNSRVHTGAAYDLSAQGSILINQGAELKSNNEGNVQSNIQSGAALDNYGLISAREILHIHAASQITNHAQATGIGAGEAYFKAGNQISNHSLLYARDALWLLSNKVINSRDIVSSGSLFIAGGVDADSNELLLAQQFHNDARNNIAYVSSAGDMEIHAAFILNESSSVKESDIRYGFDNIRVGDPVMGWTGLSENENRFLPVIINDVQTAGQHTSQQTVRQDAYAQYTGNHFYLAQIHAGNHLYLQAGSSGLVENRQGQMTARNNLEIEGKTLINSSVTRQLRNEVRTDYFYPLRKDAGENRNFFFTTVHYDDWSRCEQNNVSCYKPYYTDLNGVRRYINDDTTQLVSSRALSNGLYEFTLKNRFTGQDSKVTSLTPFGVLTALQAYPPGSQHYLYGEVHGDADGFAEVSDRYISRYEDQWEIPEQKLKPDYSGTQVLTKDVRGITGDGTIKAGQTITITATKICNTQGNRCEEKDTSLSTPKPHAGIDTAISTAQPTRIDPELIVPVGGLFSLSNSPKHSYLIETNPLLTDYAQFISSDYLLNQIGWNGAAHSKRLGDAYYEMMLVEHTIRNATTTGGLNHFQSAYEQFKYLMDNAVAAQQDLQLAVGVSLTQQQINALNASIVWMETQIVKGEPVLVPVVYLVNHDEYKTEGSLIAANELVLAGGNLMNEGDLYAAQLLKTGLAGDVTNRGVLLSRGMIHAESDGDLYNQGHIQGASVYLDVAGDITHQSAHDVGVVASVTATQGDLVQTAGGTYTAIAATTRSHGDQIITADAIYLETHALNSDFYHGKGNNFTRSSETQHLTNTLESGGHLVLNAQQDIQSHASQFVSGGDTQLISVHGNVELLAVEQTTDVYSSQTSSSGPSWNTTRKLTTSHDTSSEFIGNNINTGGNLIIDAGNNIHMQAIQADVKGSAKIRADNQVIMESLANTETSHDTRQAKSHSSYRNTDEGEIRQQLAQAQIHAGEGLSIHGEQGITLTAVKLNTQGDLVLNAQQIQKDQYGNALQNEDGSFQTVDGSKSDIRSDTLALVHEQWQLEESGKRGIARTAEKATAVIETREVTLGQHSETREKHIKEQGSHFNAANIQADADGNVHLTNITANAQTIVLSGEHVLIDAKADTHEFMHTESQKKFDFEIGDFKQGGYELAAVTDIESSENTYSHATTYQRNTLNAEHIQIHAVNTITLLNVDMNTSEFETDAKRTVIGGYQDVVETTHSKTETRMRTAVEVRNAYVDTARAANELTHALEALEKAEDAYREAKSKVAHNQMSASELKYYETNIAAAAANVVNAEIALVTQGGTAVVTTGSLGFTGGINAERSVSETHNKQVEKIWQGSNIQAANWVAQGDTLTVQGSEVKVSDVMDLQVKDVVFQAGQNETHTSSSSRSATEGASYSSSGNFAVNVGNQNNKSDSYQLTHQNSQISVGTLKVNNNSVTLEGAQVVAEHLDVDTKDLNVISLQDVYRSSSESSGKQLGLSSGGSLPNDLSGVSVGGNRSTASSSKQWVAQQSMLIGSESATIKADHTQLTGGLIANAGIDENGMLIDHGKLNFQSNTLSIVHLQDSDTAKSTGINLNTQLNDKGSTTIGGHNLGHDKQQITFATLGLGTSNHADIHRDVANSQMLIQDQSTGGLNAHVTVNHRLLSETGREAIREDRRQTGLMMQSVPHILPSEDEQGIQGDVGKALNFLGTVSLGLSPSDKNHGGLLAQIPVLAGQGDIHHVTEGDSKNIYVNGIMNTKSQALEGAHYIHGNEASLWYNPTHGFISDILESAVDLFGNPVGYQTGISQQAHEFQANNSDYTIALHSQAHLIFQYGAQNTQNNHTYFSFGAPRTIGTSVENSFALDSGKPIKPDRNDGDYVANPWNIFNPFTWTEPGHGIKNYPSLVE